MLRSLIILWVTILLSGHTAWAAPHTTIHSTKALDEQIEAVLQGLFEGDIKTATLLARQLAWRFPDFALGQLLSAELETIAAFSDPLILSESTLDQQLLSLLLEAQARHKPIVAQARSASKRARRPNATRPRAVIQWGKSIDQAIVVNFSLSQLSVFVGHEDQQHLISQHYVGIGKAGYGKELEGDNKTPVGIYSVTGKISDQELPTLYGSGALTLDYPNAVDLYNDRTGYGIWLHGVPHQQRSRSPLSSEGCVTMSNEHLKRLYSQIDSARAIVILGDKIVSDDHPRDSNKLFRLRSLFHEYQKKHLLPTTSLEFNSGNDTFMGQTTISPAMTTPRHPSRPVNRTNQREQNNMLPSQFRFRQALAHLDVNDVTIVQHPSLASVEQHSPASKFVQMRARFGKNEEHYLLIDWVQQESGHWEVLHEQWKTGTSSIFPNL